MRAAVTATAVVLKKAEAGGSSVEKVEVTAVGTKVAAVEAKVVVSSVVLKVEAMAALHLSVQRH